MAQTVKPLPTMRVQSLGWEDLLEKKMATHSSILAWKIPRMEEPGRLQSMGSQRVGHDWAISLSRTTLLRVFRIICLCIVKLCFFAAAAKIESITIRFLWGAWWAAICGVAQSRTRLKRLSSSSNSGQEALRRNGVALIVNQRVWNAVLGCNLKNDKMIYVHFQGKPFNITIIRIYAPTSNA